MCKVKPKDYYTGTTGIRAIDVVHDFDLTYNLGTSVTYILRAGKKTEDRVQDLEKAIDHLLFEIDRLKRCGS